MEIIKKLSNIFNLSDYEAGIYTSLSINGPLHIANIAKYSNIPRTAIYPPIKNLVKKGLIAQSFFGKRRYYSAVPTENLKLLFEEKRSSLENVLIELGRTTNISSESAKLDATLYSGAEGIKAAGLVFMNETKDRMWYSFENLNRITDSVGFEFENFYIQERVKRKILSKMILSVDEESSQVRNLLKEDAKQLRQTLILSSNEYLFETTIVVTRGLVFLINPNQNKFALLIRNQFLANTFISIHKFIWDRFKN